MLTGSREACLEDADADALEIVDCTEGVVVVEKLIEFVLLNAASILMAVCALVVEVANVAYGNMAIDGLVAAFEDSKDEFGVTEKYLRTVIVIVAVVDGLATEVEFVEMVAVICHVTSVSQDS